MIVSHIIMSLVLLGIVGSLVYMLRESRRREKAALWKLAQYRQINKELGFYFLCYDIVNDVVELSPQCAELLHMPERITNYFKRSLKESQEPGQELYNVAQSLRSQDGKHFYKYQDEDGKQRRFQLFTKIFEDENQRPEYVFGVFMDVTNQFHTEAKLEAKARIDGLTRLNNSGATRGYLEHNIGKVDGAVLIITDVDNFKGINDTLGHQQGDRALVLVANALKHVSKGAGFIGRLGGDEFCCYFPTYREPQQIEEMCAQLNETVRRQSAEQDIGQTLTVSIGAAVVHTGDSYEQAYAAADKALYLAKEKGRNTYVMLKD